MIRFIGREFAEREDPRLDAFEAELLAICAKYGLGLRSSDPYCPLEIVALRENALTSGMEDDREDFDV